VPSGGSSSHQWYTHRGTTAQTGTATARVAGGRISLPLVTPAAVARVRITAQPQAVTPVTVLLMMAPTVAACLSAAVPAILALCVNKEGS
jgi:hypothetical protein